MAPTKNEAYDDWVRTALELDPAQYGGGTVGTPLKAGPGRDLMFRVAAAQNRLEQSLTLYHSSKTSAQSTADLTGSVADPGPKIEKTAAEVKKNAAAAVAAIKKGDFATATKLVPPIEREIGEVAGLAASYAGAVDKANVDGAVKMVNEGKGEYYKSAAEREDTIDTPWGKLHILSLQATSIAPFVLRLSGIPELDKSFVAKYQAALKAEQDATKPMADFLAAPAKMESQIAQAASDKSVMWAEQANTNEELAKLKNIFKDNLITQLDTAKTQWQAAKKELEAQDLKEKAADLRAQAEEQEKILDFATDLFKAGIEILANPEEGAANAAAEVFTGAIKFFHESDLKKKAEEAEKQAATLHVESVTSLVEQASRASHDIQSQIDKIGPLSDDVAGSIERNVTRATKRFDEEDAPQHPNVKFRFNVLQQTIQKVAPLTQVTRAVANERYRNVWAGADANLKILMKNLGTYDKDDQFGHPKTFTFDQGLSWNRAVLDAIAAYIKQNADECYWNAQSSGDIVSKLLSLNARAFAALKKART